MEEEILHFCTMDDSSSPFGEEKGWLDPNGAASIMEVLLGAFAVETKRKKERLNSWRWYCLPQPDISLPQQTFEHICVCAWDEGIAIVWTYGRVAP